jgi:hypothetical protein
MGRKKSNITASDLTPGEKLYLSRWRDNLSQVDMAFRMDVSLMSYRAMERGAEHIPGGRKVPAMKIGAIPPNEQWVLLRLRSGKAQGAICADMGVTRYWLRRMETADGCNNDRLIAYWNLS